MKYRNVLFIDNHRWAQFHFRGKVMASLLAAGYDVTAAAPDSSYIADDNSVPGVKQVSLGLDRTSTGVVSNVKTFLEIFKIIRQRENCLVFLFTIKPILWGALACCLLHREYVAFFAGVTEMIRQDSCKGKFFCWVLHWLLRGAKEVIVLNEEDCLLLKRKKIASEKQLFVLRGGEGVDLEKYRPEKILDRHGSGFIFILIARLLWSKGIKEYINAAEKIKKKYPKCSFLLCGEFDTFHPDAVPESYIRTAELQGIIEYRGRINDVIAQLKEIDCFVLPSYYNEGMNRSLMEALALGKIIITTDHKGCREMVKNGENGILIPVQDSEALYLAMERVLMMSGGEREKMEYNSRQLAEDIFDVNYVIQHYHSLLEH